VKVHSKWEAFKVSGLPEMPVVTMLNDAGFFTMSLQLNVAALKDGFHYIILRSVFTA
jgi:hypothetical protein